MVHQKHLLSGWIKNNTNWEISVKFMIMSLSYFSLSNSNIYSSFIHCTVPEIHFLFILLSFFLLSCSPSFAHSFINPQCETMATEALFVSLSKAHKAINETSDLSDSF